MNIKISNMPVFVISYDSLSKKSLRLFMSHYDTSLSEINNGSPSQLKPTTLFYMGAVELDSVNTHSENEAPLNKFNDFFFFHLIGSIHGGGIQQAYSGSFYTQM
jgi:hypothetical protein